MLRTSRGKTERCGKVLTKWLDQFQNEYDKVSQIMYFPWEDF